MNGDTFMLLTKLDFALGVMLITRVSGKESSDGSQMVKVRQSRNNFFKTTFLPKNERTTCFHSFFGGNGRHQKDFSKLTDL